MQTISRSVVAGLIAGALWALSGGLVAAFVWFQLLDPDVYALVLPQTIPLTLWHSPLELTIATVVGSSLLVAALTALFAELLTARRTETSRVILVLAIWFTVVAIGAVIGVLDGVALLVADWPPARATFLVRGLPDSIAPTLYAGLIMGWIPAVVAAGGRRPDQNRGRRIGLIVIATAAAVMLLVSSELATAASRQSGLHGQLPPAVQQPIPSPTPSGAPPAGALSAPGGIDPSWCTDDQLSLTQGGGDAATGHREAILRATNIGATPCVLDGYPDLAFADRFGHEVPASTVPGSSFMAADSGPAPIALTPGASASAVLGWDATDGRTEISTLWAAPYPGAQRVSLLADYDITAATTVAITPWGPDLGSLQG